MPTVFDISRSAVRRADDARSQMVARWHGLIGALAVLNIVLWCFAAATVSRGQGFMSGASDFACRLQLMLSAGYVLGCAFRSAVPVFDIPRIVLIDARVSSVMVGRSVATVAELCFAAQWALVLHRAALAGHSLFAVVVSFAIVPLLLVAEIFSWHSVLTTQQRGHAAENSLWGLTAALLAASLVAIGPQTLAYLHPLMVVWAVGCVAFALFIFGFDVPMYWTRWRADCASGRRYLSLREGLADVRERRVVSYRWADWKDEILWMSLYFSFGVWSSISLIYAALALGTHGS